MPTEPKKPLIVISYAHEDEPEKPAEGDVRWLSFVTGYLQPAIKHGAVEIWIDRMMPGGADWEREIAGKLEACDIFILLVSRHSLSSDYVVDKEIPIIRERQAKAEDVHFYPLVLTPTPKIALHLVRDKNLRPRGGKPFSDYSINERYRHMSEAADEIAEMAGKIAATRRTPTASSLIGFNAVYQQLGGFIASPILPTQLSLPIEEVRGMEPEIKDRESLEVWLRGQTREVVITMASRTALRIAPLAARERSSTHDNVNFESLVSTIFFANAFAWVASRYPSRANERAAAANRVGNTAHALARLDLGSVTLTAISAAAVAANAVADTGRVAIALAEKNASVAESIIDAVVGSVAAGIAFAASALESSWEQVRADVAALEKLDPHEVADLPLWAHDIPDWATDAWSSLTASLPVPHNWQVWIEWYEERLRGSSRREEYELLFAIVPLEVWDQGPAAANAWIKAHLPREESPEIGDGFSVEAWLSAQNRGTAIAIAVRAALRVAPLASRIARKHQRELTHLAGAIFRALASARVSVQDSDRTFILSALNAAGAASDSSIVAIVAAEVARAAMFATSAAANSAAAAAAANPHAPGVAAAAVRAFVDAFVSADLSASDADTAAWNQIRSDIEATQRDGVGTLLGAPLWRQREPTWVRPAVESLRVALTGDEDWDVWFDWYEQRLRGGSPGEAYEVVFASVPQEEWDKGPAAANAWIKAHLPKDRETARATDLPEPLPDLDAPFAYGWNTGLRVELVAGAQNLPFYSFFSSEEDHRHTLDACRVSAERLLKDLREGSYGNAVRLEYSKRLKYYLEDLPKTAGEGNILLANDQVVVLRAMLARDDAVPFPFAADLDRLIEKQAALNGFYDLVRRHEQAVAKGNWSQPFPFEAAKRFIDAVRENTPRLFEPEVGEGLDRVEEAAPLLRADPERPIAPEAQPSPVEFPDLPADAPDPEHSRQRQIATAANALWTVFLKGKDLPVALESWTKAAHKLGENVGPILNFLRGLGTPL